MADLYCTVEDLPDHVVKECGGDYAGIVAVVFIEPEVDFALGTSPESIENAAIWEALIDDKLAHRILETRGEYGKAAVTEAEGFGRTSSVVTGRDHELTFETLGIKENITLFNRLNRRKDLKFAFVTNGGLLHYIDAPVTIDAGLQLDRDIKAWEFFSVTLKWTDFNLPGIYTEPDGIFES